MERFFTCVDRMVAEGVAVYIELLCSGEKKRSKQLLRDLMQVSSLAAGGPSSKLGSASAGTRGDRRADASERSIAWALIYFTLRSILSSLLVLRATRYWARIPGLANLQACCRSVADIVEDVRDGRFDDGCCRCDADGGSGCRCRAVDNGEPEAPTPSLAVAETH